MKGPNEFKQIKNFILSVYVSKTAIDDSATALDLLFQSIENVLRLGLRRHGKVWDYWNWIESLILFCEVERIFLPPAFFASVNVVRHTTSVSTIQGRGRLLLRALVQHGLLEFPIQLAKTMPRSVRNFYDADTSVMANEILVNIFSSLISTLCQINFCLKVENAEFLDDTWVLPVFRNLELVPCQKLGLRIVRMDGHLVVILVEAHSVAAEDNQIEVGDILVTMYGRTLRNLSIPLRSLRKSNEGKPIPVGVIKAKLANGSVYPGIASLLRRHNFEYLIPSLTLEQDSVANLKQQYFRKCRVIYIGQCDVGSDGGMYMISNSILRVLNYSNGAKDYLPIQMECGELGVTAWRVNKDSGEVVDRSAPLFKHSYPSIASCGRRVDDTNYLAYIVCDRECQPTNNFRCLVFEAINKQESKTIVTNISQGFERTHWVL